MLEDIQRLADQLQKHAEYRAKVLTGYGPTMSQNTVRDMHADAIERAREDGTSAPDQAEE